MALTKAFITAVTYGAAVEQHTTPVTQWTAQLAMNFVLQTRQTRYAEVLGNLCFKGYRIIPTWATTFQRLRDWADSSNTNTASLAAGLWQQEMRDHEKEKDTLVIGSLKTLRALKWR